jgi:hypothetical protein
MPKGGKVDRTVRKIQATGKSKSSAIAIAKSKGLVKQKGRKLAVGPRSKGRKKR